MRPNGDFAMKSMTMPLGIGAAECNFVIHRRAKCDHIRNGHADFAARLTGKQNDQLTKNQHRDKRNKSEIRTAQPQRRKRKEYATADGHCRSGENAEATEMQCRCY